MFWAQSWRSPCRGPPLRCLKASLSLPNTLREEVFNHSCLEHEWVFSGGHAAKAFLSLRINNHFCTSETEELHQKGRFHLLWLAQSSHTGFRGKLFLYRYSSEHLSSLLPLPFFKSLPTVEGYAVRKLGGDVGTSPPSKKGKNEAKCRQRLTKRGQLEHGQITKVQQTAVPI